MSVEQVGKNSWRIKKMKDGVKYSITVDHKPSKSEADRLIWEYIALEGDNLCQKGSFEEYANKYVSSKKNVLKSPSIVKYNSIIKNMDETFKKKQLSKITQEDVQVLINNHALTHKPKGTIDLHGFVASVLNFYRPSLVLRTTLPKKRKEEAYEPTDADIKAILSYASGGRYDVILNLLVYGLRISEAMAIDINTDLTDRKEFTTTLHITKSMVIDENGEYYIRNDNKTELSYRNVEIANQLADKMIKQGYVFDGKPTMVNKALKRFQDQLGIPQFNPHKLRHYYASMMLSLGVPITFVERSGGWKPGSNALRDSYIYSQEEKLKEEQLKGVKFLDSLNSFQ